MEGKSAFGRDSVLKIQAAEDEKTGKTYLKELFFTAPFKVMTPFYHREESPEVMILTASAGIMEGDVQHIQIETLPKTQLTVTSQAFEKIHKMKEGQASRKVSILVGRDSFLIYRPLPVIPFAESAFENKTEINLEDETSQFIYEEILSCGRAARGERFQYRYYHSLIEAKCRNKLIYRENVRFNPSSQPMEETGLFEGYTHMASLLFFHMNISQEQEEAIRKDIRKAEDEKEAWGGLTRTATGDLAVRLFGNRAQRLQEICRILAGEISREKG